MIGRSAGRSYLFALGCFVVAAGLFVQTTSTRDEQARVMSEPVCREVDRSRRDRIECTALVQARTRIEPDRIGVSQYVRQGHVIDVLVDRDSGRVVREGRRSSWRAMAFGAAVFGVMGVALGRVQRHSRS